MNSPPLNLAVIRTCMHIGSNLIEYSPIKEHCANKLSMAGFDKAPLACFFVVPPEVCMYWFANAFLV